MTRGLGTPKSRIPPLRKAKLVSPRRRPTQSNETIHWRAAEYRLLSQGYFALP